MQHEVFFLATNTVPPEIMSSVYSLCNFVFQKEHLATAATPNERSWYYLGLPHQYELRWSTFDGREVKTGIDYQRLDSTLGKSLFNIKFDRGIYFLRLVFNGELVRTVKFDVKKPENKIEEKEDAKQVNVAILIPESSEWIFERVNNVLCKQKFFLLTADQGKRIYRRQLTNSWSVALFPYGNQTENRFISEIKCANEILVLMDKEDPLVPVCPLTRIAGFMDFTVKNKSLAQKSVTLGSLSKQEQDIMWQLNDAVWSDQITIGAAQLSLIEHKYDILDAFILEWLALPSCFTTKSVYLCFNYAAPKSLLTTEHVTQFTKEILPGYFHHYATTSDAQLHVHVSCSVVSFWVLSANIDSMAKSYVSLQSVKQICLSDISPLSLSNAGLADMKSDMQRDGIPDRDDNRFIWKAGAPATLPTVLAASADVKRSISYVNENPLAQTC